MSLDEDPLAYLNSIQPSPPFASITPAPVAKPIPTNEALFTLIIRPRANSSATSPNPLLKSNVSMHAANGTPLHLLISEVLRLGQLSGGGAVDGARGSYQPCELEFVSISQLHKRFEKLVVRAPSDLVEDGGALFYIARQAGNGEDSTGRE